MFPFLAESVTVAIDVVLYCSGIVDTAAGAQGAPGTSQPVVPGVRHSSPQASQCHEHSEVARGEEAAISPCAPKPHVGSGFSGAGWLSLALGDASALSQCQWSPGEARGPCVGL